MLTLSEERPPPRGYRCVGRGFLYDPRERPGDVGRGRPEPGRARDAGESYMWITRRPPGVTRRPRAPKVRQAIRFESLELRALFSAAFDVTALTQLRADPAFAGI